MFIFCFNQKTAYEMRISDWSSDVCSSDLVFQFVYRGAFVLSGGNRVEVAHPYADAELPQLRFTQSADTMFLFHRNHKPRLLKRTSASSFALSEFVPREGPFRSLNANEALLITASRSEEHTSELQSLMRISYAVFCLK